MITSSVYINLIKVFVHSLHFNNTNLYYKIADINYSGWLILVHKNIGDALCDFSCDIDFNSGTDIFRDVISLIINQW